MSTLTNVSPQMTSGFEGSVFQLYLTEDQQENELHYCLQNVVAGYKMEGVGIGTVSAGIGV